MKAPSPKDTKCQFCRRRFTSRGVKEHERHHCAKNPNRMPRVFDKVRCAHCMKELHGNGLRAHVAQVHPEQYARSRSVRAHRMKEKRSGSAGARKEERDRARKSHKGSPAPSKEVKGALPLETRAETTPRTRGEVRKRTPPPTKKHIQSGNWQRGEQEKA